MAIIQMTLRVLACHVHRLMQLEDDAHWDSMRLRLSLNAEPLLKLLPLIQLNSPFLLLLLPSHLHHEV